jgi:hypothetical protein
LGRSTPARADRQVTSQAPWLARVGQSETDLTSKRVSDYQHVPTIGALLDQLWVHWPPRAAGAVCGAEYP